MKRIRLNTAPAMASEPFLGGIFRLILQLILLLLRIPGQRSLA